MTDEDFDLFAAQANGMTQALNGLLQKANSETVNMAGQMSLLQARYNRLEKENVELKKVAAAAQEQAKPASNPEVIEAEVVPLAAE